MKHPLSPKEKKDAYAHDGLVYLFWVALIVVCFASGVLIPLGLVLLVWLGVRIWREQHWS
jgi:hypothetical protein